MKNMKKLILILSILLLTGGLQAQNRSESDRLPNFRGGNLSYFSQWFAGAYQKECRQYKKTFGKSLKQESTRIKFYVDTLGRSHLVELLDPVPFEQERIIRDVLDSAPSWEPGVQGGKKKKVMFTLPLRINN